MDDEKILRGIGLIAVAAFRLARIVRENHWIVGRTAPAGSPEHYIVIEGIPAYQELDRSLGAMIWFGMSNWPAPESVTRPLRLVTQVEILRDTVGHAWREWIVYDSLETLPTKRPPEMEWPAKLDEAVVVALETAGMQLCKLVLSDDDAGRGKSEADSATDEAVERQAETPVGSDDVEGGRNKAHGKPRKRKKTGHRRTNEELFKAAMRTHHKYESGGSVLNVEPISTRQIEELTERGVSDSTAGRLLAKHFGSVEQYREACFSGAIGPKLVVLLGDGLHAFGSSDMTNVEDAAEDDPDD